MSIHPRSGGYQVRWRNVEGRERGRQFRTKGAAERFERRLKDMKDAGEDNRGGEMRLDAFVHDEWWAQQRDLAPKTLSFYEYLVNRYVLYWLGRETLGELKVRRVARFRIQLEDDGVAPSLVMRSLEVLGQILEEAVRYEYIPSNPVRSVRKPRPVKRSINVLPVEAIEAVRMRMDIRDATLVSVLAYAGLRPGEALALTWDDIGERSLVVNKALSLGKVQSTKTRRNRTVPLLKPLAEDLCTWSAQRWDDTLVFPSHAGKPWGQTTWQNWRRRDFQNVLHELGLEGVPYELRHTYVSLRINEGTDPVRVARDAGHGLEMCLRTYTHVFDEYDETQRVPAESRIRAVREMFPSGGDRGGGEKPESAS